MSRTLNWSFAITSVEAMLSNHELVAASCESRYVVFESNFNCIDGQWLLGPLTPSQYLLPQQDLISKNIWKVTGLSLANWLARSILHLGNPD